MKRALLATVMLFGAGCGDDDLPTVWIARVSHTVLVAGDTVTLTGRGFEVAPVVASADARSAGDAGVGLLYQGPNAVRVSGVAARLLYRSDERIDLVVPTGLPGGAGFIQVWTGGVRSNEALVFIAGARASSPDAAAP